MTVEIDDAELAAMMAELEGDTPSMAQLEQSTKADEAPMPDDEMVAALESAEAAPQPDPKLPDDTETAAQRKATEAAIEAKQAEEAAQIIEDKIAKTKEPEPAPAPTKSADHEVAVKAFLDTDQLKKDVRINPHNLDSDMIEHAALYVHYAEQTVNARRQFDRTKNAFEVLVSRLDAEYRETIAASGTKVTEAMVEKAIKADARWSAGTSKVIDAQSNWRLAEIAENAFVQRKDLLLELARDRRKEREGQLRVLEQTNQRERIEGLLNASK